MILKIVGDASEYDRALDRTDLRVETTKKKTDSLHKQTIVQDNFVATKVRRTIQNAWTKFNELTVGSKLEAQAHIENVRKYYDSQQRGMEQYLESQMAQQDLENKEWVAEFHRTMQNIELTTKMKLEDIRPLVRP